MWFVGVEVEAHPVLKKILDLPLHCTIIQQKYADDSLFTSSALSSSPMLPVYPAPFQV